MTARAIDVREDAIRHHDRRVYLSVLALGPGRCEWWNPDASAGPCAAVALTDERTPHRALQPQPARSLASTSGGRGAVHTQREVR